MNLQENEEVQADAESLAQETGVVSLIDNMVGTEITNMGVNVDGDFVITAGTKSIAIWIDESGNMMISGIDTAPEAE